MVDAVKFKSLIMLKLVRINIDDETIKYLIASCPLLQEFDIKHSRSFKRFCVNGHQNLQRVSIMYNNRIERIDIEAPNLSYLTVSKMDQRGAPQMNLGSCKKLITLTYLGHTLQNSDLLSIIPFVENLVLVSYNKCNNIKLSSHSLRTLVLHSDCDLEDIELNTPNLVLFTYGCKYSFWPLLRDSTHLKPCMQCNLDSYIDASWFQKLRLLLGKKNGFKVFNLLIHTIYCQEFIELKKLKAIELLPYELEHVELQLDARKEFSSHVALVNVVLWCCRPRSLTLRSSIPLTGFEDVVRFTCKKLLEQEDKDHTNIQILSSSSSKIQMQLVDLMTKSMVLRHEKGESVSFIKEESTLFL